MSNPDEPMFDSRTDCKEDASGGDAPDPSVRDRVRILVEGQPYAVLCVQSGGQPYGALVAFAFSPDLRHSVFVTPTETRKYRSLVECNRVALVIDNRPDKADELMEIEAVTVTGLSRFVPRGSEFDRWAQLLVDRHPYLNSFVKASTCGLFCVDVVRFLHVVRFQEVRQWIPTVPS